MSKAFGVLVPEAKIGDGPEAGKFCSINFDDGNETYNPFLTWFFSSRIRSRQDQQNHGSRKSDHRSGHQHHSESRHSSSRKDASDKRDKEKKHEDDAM